MLTVDERRARKNAYMRDYYARHAEAIKARVNEYRAANLPAIKEGKKAYREANADKVSAGKRDWYQRNRKHVIAKAQSRWAGRDVEKARETKRARRLKNHVTETAKDRAYRKQRMASDLNFRLRSALRGRMGSAIRTGAKAGSAVRDLGCSIEEFRVYIAAKFRDGMSWDNYGEWHLDHIRPLVSFDLSDREQFLRAAHYTNMQPLWAHENRAKGARILES